MEKIDIVPIHKKRNKQTLIKLPSTIAVEKLLKDYYLSKCSMKFSGYSCINQLLSITHEIMNLLMKDLKLETSSLIYQKHLVRCDMMVSSSIELRLEHQGTN